MKLNWRLLSSVLVFTAFTPIFLKLGPVTFRLSYIGVLIFWAFSIFKSQSKALIPRAIFISCSLFYLYLIGNSFIQSMSLGAIMNHIFKYIILLFSISLFYNGKINIYKFTNIMFTYLVFVVFFHIANGEYYYFKSIGEAKLLFGILPLIMHHLYGIKQYKYIVSLLILILSGERKAILSYIISYVNVKWIYLGAVPVALLISNNFSLIRELFNSVEIILQAFAENDVESARGVAGISTISRIIQLKIAYDDIIFAPIWGHGAGYSAHFMEAHLGTDSPFNSSLHNVYLSVLIEYGVVGIILYGIYLRTIWLYVADCLLSNRMFKCSCLINLFIPISFLSTIIMVLPLLYRGHDD